MTMSNEDAPGKEYYTITPHDTDDFAVPFRAIYVGVAGNVVVKGYDGTVVTFTGLLAGQLYPIGGVRINSTNTTATNMVAISVNDH